MTVLKNQEYKSRVLFFIDILAFKQIIEGDNKKSPEEIIAVFNTMKSNLEISDMPQNESKEIIHFSDSVIISFDYSDESQLFYVLLSILYMQYSLIVEHGVLIRGACYLGELLHSEDMVFGPALNKAYELESNCAIYPRIIISQEIIDICSNFTTQQGFNKDLEKDYILGLLQQDTDGYYYVDYISYASVSTEFDEPNIDWACYMGELRKFIEEGLKINKVSVNQKYLWLKDKYNKTLNENIISNL